ncbi:MAG: alpha/beta hydrolase [Anaerolineae bacterium]|nr:alpha/beta hydrolase [Anaerolineae bacterium]MBT3712556.1 alpha/beta hydrolase [Anaerolineae bacterium]MBT4309514.1 alpha/beta hydrolase [Anaerolineae bacterium]MBT4457290.1 alpha/beta hydrolase [Anaerolineae bacterium]MBT4843003.1 alpha/beta hydrolase [Anaerolineae bacterium]
MLWKTLLFILAGYLALYTVVFVSQRKMLYFPKQLQLSKESAILEGIRHWPTFENYRGFISSRDTEDVEGTVIIFHGNAGVAYHRSFYVEALSKQNMRVILAEYPGYGGREGQLSEELLVKDALETIRLAYEAYGAPLYLWGESLGCGVVASALRKMDVPIQGLVLFLPWDTLHNVAQTHYSYLPVRWLMLDKFNNVENLQGYDRKVAVLLAGEDEVIPIKHGMKLYEAITTEKKLWVFENARHNEVPVNPELQWWGEVIAFISQDQ